MSLHLVRLPLDLDALGRWSAERGLGWGRRGRRGEAEGYDEGAALHHLLGEAFGGGVLQPFRLMVAPAPGVGRARVYAYARKDAATLAETARAVLLPEAARVADLDGLDSRPMPDNWQPGQRLGFDLRLRPVVRLASDLSGHRRGQEIDAFLAEALRRPEGEMGRMGRTREAVYAGWLAERLDGAATLASARLVRFQRVRAVRGRDLSEGPDAILQGTLEVQDPQAFADRLVRGVGRHKAYGYGMLLLRPPRARAPQW